MVHLLEFLDVSRGARHLTFTFEDRIDIVHIVVQMINIKILAP
jgi:hypothetical protein